MQGNTVEFLSVSGQHLTHYRTDPSVHTEDKQEAGQEKQNWSNASVAMVERNEPQCRQKKSGSHHGTTWKAGWPAFYSLFTIRTKGIDTEQAVCLTWSLYARCVY